MLLWAKSITIRDVPDETSEELAAPAQLLSGPLAAPPLMPSPAGSNNDTVRHRTIWVVVAVAYAALASRFAPLTWPSMVATLPPVAAVIWADRHRRSERPSPAAVLTAAQVAPWAATAALLVGLEIAALPQQSRADFPTLSVFISPFAGDVTGWYRFGGYLAWFALGAWLARR